jgi:phage tail sheath protein FI
MPEYLSPGIYVEQAPAAVQPIAGVGTSTAGFIGVVPDTVSVPRPNPDFDPTPGVDAGKNPVSVSDNVKVTAVSGRPVLCTTFGEFTRAFGGFSTDKNQKTLVHAVYGFFNNGGTRCYVARVAGDSGVKAALDAFGGIDEIAIVAAPGMSPTVQKTVADHCAAAGDRFAILDLPETVASETELDATKLIGAGGLAPTTYGATYYPWLGVYDPATAIQDPRSDGVVFVPPSGHVAGIYARVDAERGVHKAPANEVVRGVLRLKYPISKVVQKGLNPQGVNAIRDVGTGIRVWGARTVGGDRNGEMKYVNVRRLFMFLLKSIDQGTGWVVFEPNEPGLWAKISRNVTAFLTSVWRDGALFGDTPSQAFYVRCDAETNPPDQREMGRVVTEIGIAIVKPAEFVIFRVSQWAGPES